MIQIKNDGQKIVSTNYWDTEHAKRGYLYLSWNAGAARLLLPDNQTGMLSEMKTGRYAIISRGPWSEQGGREALEILFEDNSASPFAVHLVSEQCDRLIPEEDQGGGIALTVWTRKGEKLRLPAKYRVVESLPNLQPWAEQ